MSNMVPPEVAELAEKHRGKLPADFFDDLTVLEADLARGQWPQEARSRGETSAKKGKRSRKTKPGLRTAVLEELRRLLCTEDVRYKEVREQGQSFTKVGIVAVAGYIAATIGVPLAMATGAVAFITLAILNIGIGAFCRLNPPPDSPEEAKS